VAILPLDVLVQDDFGEPCRTALMVFVDPFTHTILFSEVVLTGPADDE
jgi:hypothetical protein